MNKFGQGRKGKRLRRVSRVSSPPLAILKQYSSNTKEYKYKRRVGRLNSPWRDQHWQMSRPDLSNYSFIWTKMVQMTEMTKMVQMTEMTEMTEMTKMSIMIMC